MLSILLLNTALATSFVHPEPTPPPDTPAEVFQARRAKVMAALEGCTAVIASQGEVEGVRPIPLGAVFTVEPGIYLPEKGFGIRIEDEVLMTAGGYELLTAALPRKLEDVESWIEQRRRQGH